MEAPGEDLHSPWALRRRFAFLPQTHSQSPLTAHTSARSRSPARISEVRDVGKRTKMTAALAANGLFRCSNRDSFNASDANAELQMASV